MSKRGKRKAKTLTLGEFFETGEATSPATSPQSQSRFSRGRREGDIVLPQGPRASRGVDVDLSRLPEEGPCTLLISNLSYESEENRLRIHLGNIKEMGDVTWNSKDGRRDGTAFVDFLSRDGAAAALGQTDTIFGGRKIVINVAERNAEGELIKEQAWRKRDSGGSPWVHDLYPQRGGWRESRGRGRYPSEEQSEPGDDWRSRETTRERRDSSDRDQWRSHDSFSSGPRYRSYGRGGRGSPTSGDQSPDSSRRSYSHGREEWRGRGRPWRGRGDGSYRRPYGRDAPDADADPDSWRRGATDREETEDPRPPQGSPIPDRHPSSAGPGIFGGAKPVDTAAREREMELKMSNLSIDPSDTSPDGWSNRGQRDHRRDRRPYPEDRDRRSYRNDGTEDRDRRPYRTDGTEDRDRRPYRTDGTEDRDRRSYPEDRDRRPYRTDGTEDRDRRPYRTDGTEDRDRRPYRTDNRDRRPYRSDDRGRRPYGTEDRGSRKGREESRVPRGMFRNEERPNFAQNTRFSVLEAEEN